MKFNLEKAVNVLEFEMFLLHLPHQFFKLMLRIAQPFTIGLHLNYFEKAHRNGAGHGQTVKGAATTNAQLETFSPSAHPGVICYCVSGRDWSIAFKMKTLAPKARVPEPHWILVPGHCGSALELH